VDDVKDTVWVYRESSGQWTWERQSDDGQPINRADARWPTEQHARSYALVEADAHGCRVRIER
jgi:hypothetical protein